MSCQRSESPALPMEKMHPFERMAADRLPGILYSFNIADFKRRNCHLGHLRGDEDIKAFDDALGTMAPNNALVARVDGARWLMLCAHNENHLVQMLLDRYRRREPLRIGWQVEGRVKGNTKTARTQAEAAISRSVRCLYLAVENAERLGSAISAIRTNDHGLPVDRPLHLPDCAGLARKPWQCVSRYPEADPACPFCGGRSFEWADGDGMIYSGDGLCKGCGADVSISQLDEPAIFVAL